MFSLLICLASTINICYYIEEMENLCPEGSEKRKIEQTASFIVPKIEETEKSYSLFIASNVEKYPILSFEDTQSIKDLNITGFTSESIVEFNSDLVAEKAVFKTISLKVTNQNTFTINDLIVSSFSANKGIILKVQNFNSDYATVQKSENTLFSETQNIKINVDNTVIGIKLGKKIHTLYDTEGKEYEISVNTKSFSLIVPPKSKRIDMFHIGIKEGVTELENMPTITFSEKTQETETFSNVIFDQYTQKPTIASQSDLVVVDSPDCLFYSSLENQLFPDYFKSEGKTVTKQTGKYCLARSNSLSDCSDDEMIIETDSLFFSKAPFVFHESETTSVAFLNLVSTNTYETVVMSDSLSNKNIKISCERLSTNQLTVKGSLSLKSLEMLDIFLNVEDSLTVSTLSAQNCKGSGHIKVTGTVLIVHSDDLISSIDASESKLFTLVPTDYFDTVVIYESEVHIKQEFDSYTVVIQKFSNLELIGAETELVIEPSDESLSDIKYNISISFDSTESFIDDRNRVIIDYRWEKAHLTPSYNTIAVKSYYDLFVYSDYDSVPLSFMAFSSNKTLNFRVKPEGYVCLYSTESGGDASYCRSTQGKPVDYKQDEIVDLTKYTNILDIIVLDSNSTFLPHIEFGTNVKSLCISGNCHIAVDNKNDAEIETMQLNDVKIIIREKIIKATKLIVRGESRIELSSNDNLQPKSVRIDSSSILLNTELFKQAVNKVPVEICNFYTVTFSTETFSVDRNIDEIASLSSITLVVGDNGRCTVSLSAPVKQFPNFVAEGSTEIVFDDSCFGQEAKETTGKLTINCQCEELTLSGNSEEKPPFIKLSGKKESVVLDFHQIDNTSTEFNGKLITIGLLILIVVLIIAAIVFLCMKRKEESRKMPGTPSFDSKDGLEIELTHDDRNDFANIL